MSSQKPLKMLNDKWVLYCHLPSDKNWTLSAYTVIMDDINNTDKVISINETISDTIVKLSMLFLMRNGISPLWEDPSNINGGCFSYKVVNKYVHDVWKSIVYLLCGGTLCVDTKHFSAINGITISPKKNFCILKIWLNTTKFQDPNIITPITNLTTHGSMFKKHGAE